jgi:hypothetical protein
MTHFLYSQRMKKTCFLLSLSLLSACQPSPPITGGLYRMDGAWMPSAGLVPNHPAVENHMPISKELMSYGMGNLPQHCFLMKADKTLGNDSVMALLYNALIFKQQAYPFDHEILGALQKEIGTSPDEGRLIASMYLDYLKRKTESNDVNELRKMVERAQMHDTNCLQLQIKQAHADIDLARNAMQMAPDINGIPYVYRINPNERSSVVSEYIVLMKSTQFFAAQSERFYELIYNQLNQIEWASQQKTMQRVPMQAKRMEAVTQAPKMFREARLEIESFESFVLGWKEDCLATANPALSCPD